MLPSTTDYSLLDDLSPGDLCRYSKTRRDARDIVSSYIQRKFNLHKILERFFEPEEVFKFRELQATTGMLISGSTALQFLDRTVYPESDLDLYVEHQFRRPIAWWLKGVGYTLRLHSDGIDFEETLEEVPDDEPLFYGEQYFTPAQKKGYFHAASILTFESFDPYRKIELITAWHTPLEMVLNYHSTCVMNIITHEKAYSLYPQGTFEERRSLVYLRDRESESNDSRRSRAKALAKYASRGWEIVERITYAEFKDISSAFSDGERYVGDSNCWTIPIFPKLDLPTSNIEINSWVLSYDSGLAPMMGFTTFLSGKLRFEYIIGDAALRKQVSRFLDGKNHDENEMKFDDVIGALVRRYREHKYSNISLGL